MGNKIFTKRTIKKYKRLRARFPFYHCHKVAAGKRLKIIEKELLSQNAKCIALQQMIQRKQSNAARQTNELAMDWANWMHECKQFKAMRLRYIRCFYASFYPLDADKNKQYENEYLTVKSTIKANVSLFEQKLIKMIGSVCRNESKEILKR